MVPTIGRIVTATRTDRPVHPPLTGEDYVLLTVFTSYVTNSGLRQVWDVPKNPLAGELEPGSWDWPPLTVGEVDMDHEPEEGDERDTLVGVPPVGERGSELVTLPEEAEVRNCPDHLRG